MDGFFDEQFALPLAVDSLRTSRRMQRAGEMVVISALDPLNLAGVIMPGECIPSTSGRLISYCEGVPVAEMPRLTTVTSIS